MIIFCVVILLLIACVFNVLMPKFYSSIPPMKGGKWVAEVITTSYWREDRVVWSKQLTGLRRAYFAARFMALWLDLMMPYYDGEIGINWGVRDINNKDNE